MSKNSTFFKLETQNQNARSTTRRNLRLLKNFFGQSVCL